MATPTPGGDKKFKPFPKKQITYFEKRLMEERGGSSAWDEAGSQSRSHRRCNRQRRDLQAGFSLIQGAAFSAGKIPPW